MKQLRPRTAFLILAFVAGTINPGFSQQLLSGNSHPMVLRPNVPLPPHQITQTTVSIAPPVVVNFTERANYELTHPPQINQHFVQQGEDKDDDYSFQPKPITAGSHVFDGSAGISHQTDQVIHDSPAPTGSWNGVLDNGTLIPPDIAGAAGVTYVMETTNQQFEIWNKTGTVISQVQITTLFAATGGTGYYDPHILYDANYSKFVIVIDGNLNSNGDGALFIAVSQTNDPTGNWWVYAIDGGDNNTNDLMDYPEFGFNTNWVVITDNDFIGNNVTEDIWVCNRANLYSGTLGTTNRFTDNNAFSWAPALTFGTTETTEYLVQDANGSQGGNGYMQIGSITGTVNAPVYNAGNTIGINQPWNENAVGATQLGGGNTLEDGDTRVGNGSVYINGSLWFAHTVFLPATNPTHDGVDWWQINPSALTVTQFGRIADNTAAKFYYYPTIAINNNGDALLGYSESGTNLYSGAAYSYRSSTDPLNTMQSDTIYKPGQANYFKDFGGGRNRWGDFTGTQTDPVDGSFWNFGEWAQTGNNWGTVVAHVPATGPDTFPPVANFSALNTSSCTGSISFSDLSTNNPTSWAWTFGDGGTSTLQNPTHTYITNGTFTVTLIATNTYGSNTKTITSYITIDMPAGPATTGASGCGASTYSLSANTTNHVNWIDSVGAIVSTSNPFITPVINHTTTYWVRDTVPGTIDSVGPRSTSTYGVGNIYPNTADHYLTFDVYAPCTLLSVVVQDSGAGNRVIALRDASGTTLQSVTVNMPAGINTITVPLNFSLSVGTGFELAINGTANLFRNSNLTTGFPYTLPGFVSITGNNVPDNLHYYYFYNWKIEEGYCVSLPSPATVTISPSFSLTSNITNANCFGSGDGSATVTPVGGNPQFTYAWSNGQTAATATNLGAGTFLVTVTDATGCASTASETVSSPTVLVPITSTTGVACHGSGDGSASVTVTGGTSGYTYNWGGGITTQQNSGLTGGIYTVTITDAHLCTATATALVGQPAALSIATVPTNTPCSASTGSVQANPSGGTAGYSYAWNTGASTSLISNLTAGTYTLTVTDSHNCTATATSTVSFTGSLNLVSTTNGTSCFGDANGTASVSITGGGINPIVYTWSTGATTETVNNLSAGNYSVTVSDGSGCSATAAEQIGQPPVLSSTITHTNAGCGASNGTAIANAFGGTAGYSYLWSSGASADSLSNLAVGTYTVTITDAHSCSTTATTSIVNSGLLTLNPSLVEPNCFGGNDGSASVAPTGGTGPFNYVWSNGGTAATINNITAGTYTVTGTDAGGCSGTLAEIVNQPSQLNLTVNSTNTGCGASNGTAAANASGGTAGYTYLWTGGLTTDSITSLTPGSYSVTVTDAHGCSSTSSATIINSGTLSLNATTNSTNCFGGADGSATVTPVGGTGNISYIWSNGGTTATINNVGAGTYTVTVTDGTGCSGTASETISSPTAVNATITATNAACGQSNGSALADASGGTSGYTYLWSNGSTQTSITNLAAGAYVVTVTDAHSCTGVAVTNIISSSSLVATITITNENCNGGSTGGGSVNVTSGTAPYTYLWSNGATAASISNVIAGSYIVTITDGDNCQKIDTVGVTQPTAVAINTATVQPTCNGFNNGSASVAVSGGTSSYTYLWSNGSSNNSISNLSQGSYTVTVNDAHGCTAVSSITIANPVGLTLTTSSTNATTGQANGSATVDSIQGGTSPYTYLWSNGQGNAMATGLAAGTYTVTVTDKNGCDQTATVVINAVTGISSINGDLSFEIYPNPARTVVFIQTNYYPEKENILTMKDMLGQTVLTRPINNSQTRIDLSSLANGVYLIEIREGEKQAVKKFVISR